MTFRRSSKIWIWPLGWALVIFATSSTVIHSRQFVSTVAAHLPVDHAERHFASFWESWWWLFVKGYHALEFAILTLLCYLSLRRLGPACVLAIAYAATDEFHQTFVPGRGGRFTDVLIDSLGVGVAALLIGVARRGRKGSQRKCGDPNVRRGFS